MKASIGLRTASPCRTYGSRGRLGLTNDQNCRARARSVLEAVLIALVTLAALDVLAAETELVELAVLVVRSAPSAVDGPFRKRNQSAKSHAPWRICVIAEG